MVRNKKSGGKVFYVQFVDDGTRRPFTVNHDYKFFFMKEEPAVDYNTDRDYYSENKNIFTYLLLPSF